MFRPYRIKKKKIKNLENLENLGADSTDPVDIFTHSYGHIRIRYELLRTERIDTENLSAASVASVYASVTVL